MAECQQCGSGENVDSHHIQYEPEETVPLCRRCHKQTHADPESEYYPKDEPPKTTIQISLDTKHRLDGEKRVSGETYSSVITRLLGGGESIVETEAEVRDIVHDVLAEYQR